MDSPKQLFTDDEVGSLLLRVIREAKSTLVVVTPFVDLIKWRLIQDAIQLAIKSGVRVTFFVRPLDEHTTESEKKRWEANMRWLSSNRVDLFTIRGLHAKVYLNDEMVVFGSMNLTSASALGSHEIASVATGRLAGELRDYVSQTLKPLAAPLNDTTAPHPLPSTQPGRTQRSMHPLTGMGRCIRCGVEIRLDADRPLCEECYGSWSEWGNADYPEHFCHSCGLPSEVSYARPLCGTCFRRT